MLNSSDQLNKFEARADECYFMGYSSNQRAYHVYNQRRRIVLESIDINWHETNPFFSVNTLGPINDSSSSSISQPMDIPPAISAQSTSGSSVSVATSETVEEQTPPIVNVGQHSSTADPATEAINDGLFSCFISQIVPKNVKAALLENSWVEAMQEELQQFLKVQVWNLVDLPKNKVPIGTRWGFYQERGTDFEEVFALVACLEAIRMFLAYTAYMDFTFYQMDVKSAFLYGKVQEEVYVK
ncbi:hypothetical protein L1987_40911 [Smallanthus sonchifolius]|uniref:Uncharacterized protein n=1 Tax=Smallanthus sonchifolius TaxID=185202 RepID=A0ACB9GU16_9ASTR|nr:hypothetical protein L1987_40911 [Smallanthus sonchifolius]